MEYLLVHGSWHGGWYWKYLAECLRKRGHSVQCLDLPGHGENEKDYLQVTYDDYYSCVEAALMRYKSPLILIAHSMSGIIAGPLLEKRGDLIWHLFLIAAYIPCGGMSLMDIAMTKHDSAIPSILEGDSVNREGAKQVLYGDCSKEVQEWAASKLQPQPPQPLFHKIDCDYSEALAKKRTYILCEQDCDVTPATQLEMIAKCPCQVLRIKSGHFPFLSQPEALADLLSTLHSA